MKKLTITLRNEGSTSTWTESYDIAELRDPLAVGQREKKLYQEPVEDEASALVYAGRLISAFNSTRRPLEPKREVVAVSITLHRFTPFNGPACPRRCHLCCDHEKEYAAEHHWMLEYGDEEEGTSREEGLLICRHCDATREIPLDDEEFLDAFGL